MKATANLQTISKRFAEIRNIDKKQNERLQSSSKLPDIKVFRENQQIRQPRRLRQKKQSKTNLNEIVSKNQIIWKIQRIKPFLEKVGHTEQQSTYSFNDGQDDLLCEVLLKQNQRLCNKFIERPKLQQNTLDLRKPGCGFQGPPPQNAPQFNKEMMQNGFVFVTQILQFYHCLGDINPVFVYKFKQLQFVRYQQDLNYDYIRIKTTIKQKKGWINIGFISKKRMIIFDQMTFLAYQLTNSVPGNLFKNDILKDNFEKY